MNDSDYESTLSTKRGAMFIFELPGVPKVQKQTRFARGKFYDPSYIDKHQIRWQVAPYAPENQLLGPMAMDMTFFMPIPKGITRAERNRMINGTTRPNKRPDFDNLAYIITNALKGLIYRDDGQVVDCSIHKYYAEVPRTVLKVWEL